MASSPLGGWLREFMPRAPLRKTCAAKRGFRGGGFQLEVLAMIPYRLMVALLPFLLIGLGGCTGSEESKRLERDRDVRTLVKSIQDNDLPTAT